MRAPRLTQKKCGGLAGPFVWEVLGAASAPALLPAEMLVSSRMGVHVASQLP